jgi:hypothetical protein
MFGIDLSVYDKIVDEQTIYSNFRLLCIFPDSPRWKNFKTTPKIGGYVQVSGEVNGLCDVHNRRSLCVLITEISFLPPLSKPPPSSTIPSSSTTSPKTPRKRLRQRGEAPSTGPQRTPSKQLQEEAETRASPVDVTIGSSYTETITNDGNDGNDGDGSSTTAKRKRKKKVIMD